jgi:hypothetical protein
MVGGFRAVEVYLGVSAVAEGFVGGLSAAAERILLLFRVLFSFVVVEGFAFSIGPIRCSLRGKAPLTR